MAINLRELRAEDKPAWLELWAGYLAFYEHPLPAQQTELTWLRLLNSEGGLSALVADLDGEVVGLAHYFWTPSTWQQKRDLYLEDLFVDARVRNQGVGKQLIEALVEICKISGGGKVHWQTHHSNQTAMQLYDKVGKRSEFVVYEISLS